MGESRNAYRVLVGRPEGKRSLGRPRRRWEGNIKMDLREVGYDYREWINLAQDGGLKCECCNEPPGSLKANSGWSRGRWKMECQMEKVEHFRHILLFEFNRGAKAAEPAKNICALYGDKAIRERMTKKMVFSY
ncbi:hypothetical protein ANN_06670 [Periplaneta americana]|uniref:Mos1 transposase HTH domain-containing protein n=1 Tax=Periplaneta americana TaxID=6978 RepID=A0ABQ8TG02_PERAM|nr:hypothetical protein ANN_06670 [Periplaneta americana]